MRTLQLHMVGQDVLTAQCALTAADFYHGDIDGCYGPTMASAVRQFQTAKSLTASGDLEASTARGLGLQDPVLIVCALPNVTPELVQSSLFRETTIDNVRANLPFVLNALAEQRLTDRDLVRVALATLRTEAASFLPVSEQVSHLNTIPGGSPFGRYANRLGNRSLSDAAKYRGRGFIQITGLANYLCYSRKILKDDRLVNNPLLVHDQMTAARIFAQFLKDREEKLRAALAAQRLDLIRALVNGGNNGESTFEAAYDAAAQLP